MSLSVSKSSDTSRQKIMIITTDESILHQLKTDKNKLSFIEHVIFSTETNSSQQSTEKVTISLELSSIYFRFVLGDNPGYSKESENKREWSPHLCHLWISSSWVQFRCNSL